MIMV